MYVCVAALLILIGIPQAALSLTVSSGPMQDYLFKEGKRHLDAGDINQAQEVWSNLFPGALYGPVSYLLLAQGWTARGAHGKAEFTSQGVSESSSGQCVPPRHPGCSRGCPVPTG